jgi:hypothetical protein
MSPIIHKCCDHRRLWSQARWPPSGCAQTPRPPSGRAARSVARRACSTLGSSRIIPPISRRGCPAPSPRSSPHQQTRRPSPCCGWPTQDRKSNANRPRGPRRRRSRANVHRAAVGVLSLRSLFNSAHVRSPAPRFRATSQWCKFSRKSSISCTIRADKPLCFNV